MDQEKALPAILPGTDAKKRRRGIVVHSRWMWWLLTFLFVVGPGLIVMVADNDAGAVSTYIQAGAQYGTRLLWVLLLLWPMTYFIQEMVVRLGIATGKGHAAMIFERFGPWWGFFSLADLELVNFLTLVTEFAAIALAVQHLGISPYLGVPIAAVGLLFMVLTGSYLHWEHIVLVLCSMDLGWLWIAFKMRPGLGELVDNTFVPGIPAGGLTGNLVFLLIALVGTTIAPWQLFFQQSCIADKKLRFSEINSERMDTFVGGCVTVSMAACMTIAGTYALKHGLHFDDPAQMAVALRPLLGNGIRIAILLLMINAAVVGATTISLASAWAYGEVRGWPHSLQLPFKQAKGFYITYLACVGLAAAIVLIPRAPLQLIIVGVQVLAGIMLPSAIIFLQLLLNDKQLLGDYVNKPWNNIVNWIIITVLFALSLVLAAQVIAPNLFPSA